MIKFLVASGAVVMAAALGSPVLAGPYVNVENNAGFIGSDFGGYESG